MTQLFREREKHEKPTKKVLKKGVQFQGGIKGTQYWVIVVCLFLKLIKALTLPSVALVSPTHESHSETKAIMSHTNL